MGEFIGPAFVRINYHYPGALHTMTIPTKTWNAGTDQGTFDTWSGSTFDAATMIVDLVTVMQPFFTPDTVFDNFVIYRQLLPADIPQPVASNAIVGKAGSSASSAWASAVEAIIIARTSLFGIAKLDFLDASSEDSFAPVLTPDTKITNLMAEWTNSARGWSGRDNGQVVTFLKETKNLNQALRKAYRYT